LTVFIASIVPHNYPKESNLTMDGARVKLTVNYPGESYHPTESDLSPLPRRPVHEHEPARA
jgi:hypothetical protein